MPGQRPKDNLTEGPKALKGAIELFPDLEFQAESCVSRQMMTPFRAWGVYCGSYSPGRCPGLYYATFQEI